MKTTRISAAIQCVLFSSIIVSGQSIAMDQEPETEDKVRFSVPFGPFSDPIMGTGVAVIPTAAYKLSDSPDAKTSTTSVTGAYTDKGAWSLQGKSSNYWGDRNEWYGEFVGMLGYAEMDLDNFMRYIRPDIDDSPTAAIKQNMFEINGNIGYKFFDDMNLYIGPSFKYMIHEVDRYHRNPYHTSNVFSDKTHWEVGLSAVFDERDNLNSPKNGFYAKADVRYNNRESTKGTEVFDSDGNLIQSMNGEAEYYSLKTDVRYYTPVSNSTTLALRNRTHFNSSEGNKLLGDLSSVANGFTMAKAGRSAVGAEAELRHWMTSKWGAVAGVSLAQPIEVNDGADDDLQYAGIIGLRYMLLPKDNIAARLDFAYNSEDKDNFIVYFSVGESF